MLLKRKKFSFVLLILALSTGLFGTEALVQHGFYLAPEAYHLRRTREGGTEQTSVNYGVRAGYDRIGACKIYWGLEGAYSQGRLKGESGVGNHIRSNFKEWQIEGRLGYTLAQTQGWQLSFTPFIGYGYGEEQNNFIEPSPLKIHTNLFYHYVPAGFLASFCPYHCWQLGLNFKAEFIFNCRSKISRDPEFDSAKMLVGEKVHYRVEIPLSYSFSECWSVSLVPFAELRHYGSHANFPFDFLKTKLYMYGSMIKFILYM